MALDDILSSVMGAEGGDGQAQGPAPTIATTTEAIGRPPAPASGGGDGQAQGAEEAPGAQPEVEQPFQWDTLDPSLVPLAKQLQGDYTRKTQALAEQRKQYEGVDPSHIQAWSNLVKMTEEDPAQAAAWFRQQAEWLGQQAPVAEPGETDLFSAIEPQSETERLLFEKLQSMEEQQKQFQGFYEQQVRAQQEQAILGEFGALEQKIGRQLPQAERDAVMQFCVENGIPKIEVGYRAYAYDEAVQRAEQAGIDKGAAVLTQKAAMSPPPASLATRQATGAGAPKGLDALLAQAIQEAGLDD